MSRSQIVAEHLPLLRRYARALTGSQSSGDAYVAAMLEALLQDPIPARRAARARARVCSGCSPRSGIRSALNDDTDVATCRCRPERRLSNITPLPRQAFLLLSLEGFSEERGGLYSRHRRRRDAAPRRCGRPRNGRRNRHRRPDHRGRDLHRDGSREPGAAISATTSSAWRAPMPTPSRSPEPAARADPGGHPARRRLLRARRGERTAAHASRCPWCSSPLIRSAS